MCFVAEREGNDKAHDDKTDVNNEENIFIVILCYSTEIFLSYFSVLNEYCLNLNK
jgi:hypothetical protein